MKNLEEINFTAEDFELMQKALGCVCLAESGNSPSSMLDALLDSMPSMSGPYGGSSFLDGMRQEQKKTRDLEKKTKSDDFNERKITLQYKLIQFKKFLQTPVDRKYTYDEWVEIERLKSDPVAMTEAHGVFETEKKSHEPAFSEES